MDALARTIYQNLEVIAERNVRKAKMIYDVLDSSKFFKGHAVPNARSLMNITFKCPTPELDERFVKEAGAQLNIPNEVDEVEEPL